jgi:glycosyltransferase involved in cell wall biosynthesis
VGHVLLFYPASIRYGLRETGLPAKKAALALLHGLAAIAALPHYFVQQYVTGRRAMAAEPAGAPILPNLPALAIVNINKAKYTETFIWEAIPRLSFRVYYLHGGSLPQFDNDDRHFLSNWQVIQRWAAFIETAFGLEEDYFLRQSIAGYLHTKKIRIILAQFGPTGVQMLRVARDTGLPLAVYFHGYDVYRTKTLNENLAGYRELFREAKALICVSEQMVARLAELGAPQEKLFHLPAFVNIDLFPYADHSALPPTFLAVGRFAETKSPHLTILAFQKVAEQVPDAKLVMIGKDGGGELFEACVILVKSLSLEEKVIFKGVQTHVGVADEMRHARVLVQHSLTTPEQGDREGKPVAIMEAMACGLPVVATRHSGISELIDHGVSGLLVPEYDIDAMAQAMLLLLRDDLLARQIGQQASQAIRRNPLIAQHPALLENILMQIIAQNPAEADSKRNR